MYTLQQMEYVMLTILLILERMYSLKRPLVRELVLVMVQIIRGHVLFQAMVGAGTCVSYLKEKKKGGCVCWRNASEPLGLAKKEQSSPAEG